MRLLICTQAVDVDDPILGFFCRWIEEFAKRAERVEVICLKEGKHSLPANVLVHSLGKIIGSKQKAVGSTIRSRIRHVWRFYKLIWRLRREYDAVFVHMNPEYVVLGGPLWRFLGKRIALWYTHKSVNPKLRIAAFLSHVIFTASKESFRLRSGKVRVMGHGIDTDFFSPDASVARGDWMLSVGRLMPSKRHDLAIRAATLTGKELRVVGDGPERERLETLAKELGANVRFLGGLTQVQVRYEYRKAAVLMHTSETGSLDKVVLEALACGLPVVTTSNSLSDLPVMRASAIPEAMAQEILTARETEKQSLSAYVREHHSLELLVPRVVMCMDQPVSDPKTFYDTLMPEKLGSDYEHARWRADPLLVVQYGMMADTLGRSVVLNMRHARRVLEVGPGPGTWTKILLEANPGAQYTLVDISREMLAQAREKLAERANVSFVESDLASFEAPRPYDYFFSSRAIEYMPDKRGICWKISSLLAPGARGTIVTKMPKPFLDRLRGRSVSALHGAQIRPAALARLLGESGLTVENARIATATVPLARSPSLNELAFRLLKRLPLCFPLSLFAESYIITFGKPL